MQRGRFTRRSLLKLGTSSAVAFTVLGLTACASQQAQPTTAPAASTPAASGATPAAKATTASTPAAATPAAAATSATGATPAAKPAASTGPATINQWYHEYGEKGTQQAVMKYAQDYMTANPSVKVTVTWTPGDYAQKLAAGLASGQGPDVYETMPTVAMVKANQCIPLDDLLVDVKSDFDPKDLQACTVNGKVYAIKMIDDTGALYYRKSLLQSANVQPPKTWDDLVAMVPKLTTRQQKGLFIGNDGGISALLTLLPASAGSQIINDSGIQFNNDMTVAAYENLAKLNKTGSLLTGSPTDWWDPSAFTQGLAAMVWGGLWAYPATNAALKDDFDVLPWPGMTVSGGTPAPQTFWGGWAELVNGQSKFQDASKAFVKWLWIDNKQIQTDWATSYGFHVPPRKSVAAAADALKSGRPAEMVKNLYAYGQILPPIWDATMGTDLTNALSNIVKLGKDAKSEVAAAATACTKELAAEQG